MANLRAGLRKVRNYPQIEAETTHSGAFRSKPGKNGRFGLLIAPVWAAPGDLDPSFGSNGQVVATIPNTGPASSVALQTDGKIVGADSDGTDFAVVRFLNGNVTPFDFDGDNKTDLSIFRPSDGVWWYQESSTNQVAAAQFGEGSDQLTPADFTGDGKTDLAVFRPSTGEWFILRSEDYSY